VPGRDEILRHFAAMDTAVLVEKPFANSAAEQVSLASLFQAHRIGVGYQRRFYATTAFIETALRQRWFGRLRRIVHREGLRATRAGISDYQDQPITAGGGITKNLACHGIDVALHTAGATEITLNEASLELDQDTDRRVRARIGLSGASGDVELDLLVSHLDQTSNDVRFDFDTCTITCPVQPSRTLRIGSGADGTGTVVGLDRSDYAFTSSQAFYLEWQDFLSGVRDGRPSTIAAGTALLTMKAIDAILSGR
jgi:predicted dehydrogenase